MRPQLACRFMYPVPSPARLVPIDRRADCFKEQTLLDQRISGCCLPCCGAGLRPPKVFAAIFNPVLSSFEASAAADVHRTCRACQLLTPQICLWPSCTWPSWCRKCLGLMAPLAAHDPPPAVLLVLWSQQAGICFVTLASQGADSRPWCVAHWLFLLPRSLPSSPHLSPLALWRPEALAQWNGDFPWPQPSAENRRYQRCGAAAAGPLRVLYQVPPRYLD